MSILPQIITQNQASRRMRIWSAGCAVGAEPYSVAILLERLLGDALRSWTIEIIGSDISHRVLSQARDGVFSNWTLRGMAEADRLRDFALTPDRRHWQIADRHRMRIRFVPHNLLHLLEADEAARWHGFDLILCRNVLIYFSPSRIAPMISALARCLTPSGWLMVGHSDAIAALPDDLAVVELAGTIAFRPPASPADCRFDPVWTAGPADALPEAMAEDQAEPSTPESGWQFGPAPRAHAAPLSPEVGAIRALADAGRLQEAARACAAAIAEHPLDPCLHFYDGVIAQARGHKTQAEAALRRAIYLSGTMVMAHYHLGLLLLDSATPEAGHRSMVQVLKLCAVLPDSDILPESDGLTPRDLAQRVEMRLRPRSRG